MLISTSHAVFLAGALALAPFTATASLLSYEPFSYAAGADGLAGQTGGSGFDGAWSLAPGETNSPATVGSGFGYTDSNGIVLPTEGGRALADSTTADTVTAFRQIAGAASGVVGSTIYLSFIGQQTAGTERFANLALYSTGLTEILAIGHGTSSGDGLWGAYVNGIGGQGGYSTTPTTSLAFLVLRIDLNIAATVNDRIRLYVNPTLGTEPAVADVDVADYDLFSSFGAISQLRIGAGNSDGILPASQMQFDEIRIADTYASATPIPEPSALALLAGTLATMGLRRRR